MNKVDLYEKINIFSEDSLNVRSQPTNLGGMGFDRVTAAGRRPSWYIDLRREQCRQLVGH